jgi:hypothetical protein
MCRNRIIIGISATIIAVLALTLSIKSYQIQSNPKKATYQAPLRRCEDPDFRVLDSYHIYLHPGHSLQQHSEAIGTNIEPYIGVMFVWYREKIAFSVVGVDDDLLARIRTDPGVDFLEEGSYVKREYPVGEPVLATARTSTSTRLLHRS